MSCNLKLAIPIPDGITDQGAYAANVARRLADYFETQRPLTSGNILDPVSNSRVIGSWECQSEAVEPPPERRKHTHR